MLLRNEILLVIFISYSIKSQEIVVTLESDKIVDALKAVFTSQYMKEFTNNVAQKAADKIIREVKNEHLKIANRYPSYSRQREDYINDKPELVESIVRDFTREEPIDDDGEEEDEGPDLKELDEDTAMSLLDEPSPDGDNMDKLSVLSDVETNTEKSDDRKIRINGMFFRKLANRPIFLVT